MDQSVSQNRQGNGTRAPSQQIRADLIILWTFFGEEDRPSIRITGEQI